jgi:hypothetical protein
MTWPLTKVIWQVHQQMRPRILDLLRELYDHKQVIRLRSPEETRHLLASL